MPQYVLRAQHSSDQCPSANANIRDFVMKAVPEIPQIASKLGVKVVIGPLVLGSEHESIAVVEADSIEKVVEFSELTALAQWNSVRISPARTMQEALQQIEVCLIPSTANWPPHSLGPAAASRLKRPHSTASALCLSTALARMYRGAYLRLEFEAGRWHELLLAIWSASQSLCTPCEQS